jgi:hypothetical protein
LYSNRMMIFNRVKKYVWCDRDTCLCRSGNLIHNFSVFLGNPPHNATAVIDDTSLLRSDSQFLFPNKMPLTIPPELKSITPYIRRAEEVRFISKISLVIVKLAR